MLAATKLMAFIPTRDFARARSFFEGTLGLKVLSQDDFAMVLDANGTRIRVTQVGDFQPQKFTILGWQVPNIEQAVSEMSGKGVKFEIYNFPGQDNRGIWTAPGGDKVAWFKDPDGNVLSVSQHQNP